VPGLLVVFSKSRDRLRVGWEGLRVGWEGLSSPDLRLPDGSGRGWKAPPTQRRADVCVFLNATLCPNP